MVAKAMKIRVSMTWKTTSNSQKYKKTVTVNIKINSSKHCVTWSCICFEFQVWNMHQKKGEGGKYKHFIVEAAVVVVGTAL